MMFAPTSFARVIFSFLNFGLVIIVILRNLHLMNSTTTNGYSNSLVYCFTIYKVAFFHTCYNIKNVIMVGAFIKSPKRSDVLIHFNTSCLRRQDTYKPFDAIWNNGQEYILLLGGDFNRFHIFWHFLFETSGPPPGLMTYILSDAPWHKEQECIWFSKLGTSCSRLMTYILFDAPWHMV